MKGTVEEYKDTKGENRLRVRAENGAILFPLEGYKKRADLKKAAIAASKAILNHFKASMF